MDRAAGDQRSRDAFRRLPKHGRRDDPADREAHHSNARESGRVHQRQHVAGVEIDCAKGDRLVAPPYAPLVRRENAPAGRREPHHLPRPERVVPAEAVDEEDGRPLLGPCRRDVLRDPVATILIPLADSMRTRRDCNHCRTGAA